MQRKIESGRAGWIVVDTESMRATLGSSVLGLYTDSDGNQRSCGTWHGAFFFLRRMAVKASKAYGVRCRVVKVRFAEVSNGTK